MNDEDCMPLLTPEEEVDKKKKQAEKLKKYLNAIKILELLDIPVNKSFINQGLVPTVPAVALCEILLNSEKLQNLVSKLKLKAFW